MTQYICRIIGDGKSTATAFRPAIADVVVPVMGTSAFPSWSVIGGVPTDGNGVPISLTCTVEVQDNTNAALVSGNPDISTVVS